MADDVFEVMLAIAKNLGGLSHTQAVEFFDKMKQEKRFTSDLYLGAIAALLSQD